MVISQKTHLVARVTQARSDIDTAAVMLHEEHRVECEGHWMFRRPLVRNLEGLDEGGTGWIDAQQIVCRRSSQGREWSLLREALDVIIPCKNP